MKTSLVYINGEFKNSVAVEDRGFSFGDGLFETMRLYRGRIPLWQFHRERLLSSLEKLSILIEPSMLENQLEEYLTRLKADAIENGGIKIIVTRKTGGRGCYPSPNSGSSICFMFRELLEVKAASRVELIESQHRLSHNPSLAGIKHLNRLDYIFAANATPVCTGQELLLLDNEKNIVETMHHNIFAVCEGKILTPKVDKCGVRGVMRNVIINSIALKLNFYMEEVEVNVKTLISASEVFLTNALTGVISVSALLDSQAKLLRAYADEEISSKINNIINKEYFHDEN